eukprot:scaffold189655_cov31-Tisochrysis_lutea.AAC.3
MRFEANCSVVSRAGSFCAGDDDGMVSTRGERLPVGEARPLAGREACLEPLVLCLFFDGCRACAWSSSSDDTGDDMSAEDGKGIGTPALLARASPRA